MNELTFHVPAIPVAQPRQRYRVATIGGRAMAMNYTPTKHPVNVFKAACQMAAHDAYRGPPIDAPIIMDVVAVFPRPASVPKRLGVSRLPHAAKPDRDNVMKSLQDALEGVLFKNDSQIYDGRFTKWKAAVDEQPHLEITLRWMSE